jgi:hypothetical protein
LLDAIAIDFDRTQYSLTLAQKIFVIRLRMSLINAFI